MTTKVNVRLVIVQYAHHFVVLLVSHSELEPLWRCLQQMFECWRNLAVIVLVVIMPSKTVNHFHAEFLQYARNFVGVARAHTDHGAKTLEFPLDFFDLRQVNGALALDVTFYFGFLANRFADGAEPSFKTGNAVRVNRTHIRYTVSFFEGVAEVGAERSANANHCLGFAQVRKFFDSGVTINELRFCADFLEKFRNLRTCAFKEVLEDNLVILLLRRFHDAL